MEQFNLDKWLQDKSRKVVTRDGREVSIERTDLRGNFPILAIISNNSEDYDIPMTYNNKGKNIDTKCEGISDLFFADEEEELTEFEYAVGLEIFDPPFNEEQIKVIKDESSILLNIALKQLQQDIDKKVSIKFHKRLEDKYDVGFKNGYEAKRMEMQDALKDLPKWKKLSRLVCFDRTNSGYFAFIGNDTSKPAICCNGYYISLADLENLPKEE